MKEKEKVFAWVAALTLFFMVIIGHYNANPFATLVLYVFRFSIIGYFLFWLCKEFKLYRYSNRRHEQSMKFLFKMLQASKKVNRK